VIHPGFLNLLLPATALGACGLILWAGTRRSGVDIPGDRSQSKPRTVAFASSWLVLPILPLLNLSVFPEGDFAHDRYLYLPSVGFAIIAAIALGEVHMGHKKQSGRPSPRLVLALGVAVLLALGTGFQSLIWADDLVLYSRALKAVPTNNLVCVDLAGIMASRGFYGSAIDLYKQSLARDPAFWPANFNLGCTYYRLRKFDEAEAYLRRAISLKPNRPDAYLYLGLTQLERGRLEDASSAIREAIRIRPEAQGYHFYLGMVLKLQGDLAGALDEFRTELTINPELEAAKEQMGEIRLRLSGPRSGALRGTSPRPLRAARRGGDSGGPA
jgi:tetratricopeptide (TPR) repeat protein